LIAGFITGLLVGGTGVALPISHGRISNAFKANLELLGADIITFTAAATVSAYCVSRLMHNRGYIFRRRDERPNGGA